MTSRLTRAALAIGGIVLAAAPMMAHHGDSGRYEEKLTTVKGKVVDLQLVNPHSFLVLDVPDSSGKSVKWRGELGSAVAMKRWSWSKDTIKIGSTLAMTGRRLKNGSPFMTLSEGARVVDAGGKELYRGNDPGKPAPAPATATK
jgi:hypothetical protein